MSEWPEPEVWARPAEASEIPSRSAGAVAKAAERAGWDVTVTYARGTYAFPVKPAAVVDSLLLRMAHADGRRAAAHWLDGGFDDAYAWSPTSPLRKLGANNLKHALAEADWPTEAPAASKHADGRVEPWAASPAMLARRPVPGSWGTVHVGDVVRGADQRPWTVIERGPALRWVVAGESADFTLSNPDRGNVTIRRGLADPCDVMARDDHTATAAAVGALIDGGLNVEILREGAATNAGGGCGEPGCDYQVQCTTCLHESSRQYDEWWARHDSKRGTFLPGQVERMYERDHAEAIALHEWAAVDGQYGDFAPGEHMKPAAPVRAERPCDDPFCGGPDGGCGWAASAHIKPAARTAKEHERARAVATTTVEEREPVGDEFQSAVPQVQFDRWGRYRLPDPVTGEMRSWTRVSTVASTLADTYNLTQWKMRMVAKGVAIRPDLIAGAAAADTEHDKKDLAEIAGKAMDAAEASAGATFGTALHNFTRRLDTGTPAEALHVPSHLLSTVKAYIDCLRMARLNVEHAERIVVLPDLGIAGEFDRIVIQPPGVTNSLERSILDLKSGKDLSYGWLEIVIQQALYARAPLMWDPATQRYEPKPDVDLDRALILHLPVGQGVAQLYGINITEGWRLAQLALQVRAERTNAKKLAWLVTPDDPIAVALHKIATASQADLAAMWERLNKSGHWTEEVNAAAHARMSQLQLANDRAESATWK